MPRSSCCCCTCFHGCCWGICYRIVTFTSPSQGIFTFKVTISFISGFFPQSDEGVPNSSHPGSPNSYSSSSSPSPNKSDNPNTNKGYSSEVESPEEVSFSDSPSPSPKSTGDVIDSETLALAPAPSNAIEIKATTCIVGVVTIVGFFFF
ncbi:hypothetical protein ES332_A02G191300v1 [Gossypium tomentosum]|uniref:Uncharacterized protein n=1 Tax=Gossypium tomentosum TaxID=34277 RepID=A0A5D2RJ75_GOSTO|nr:hypothetical protein ES332_A02G191300v1 [Gossypium tomentosum]